MNRSEIVAKLMFEWDLLEPGELDALTADLPRKVLRWIGTHHPDNRSRKYYFRKTGVKVGSGVVLNPGLLIEDSYRELVTFCDRASVAPNVMVIADAAPNNSRIEGIPYVKEHLIVAKETVIGVDSWIGAAAIILPGVTVGEGAIVGAGAIVTKDVAPYTVVAGAPARVIRTLERTPET